MSKKSNDSSAACLLTLEKFRKDAAHEVVSDNDLDCVSVNSEVLLAQGQFRSTNGPASGDLVLFGVHPKGLLRARELDSHAERVGRQRELPGSR